MPLVDVMMILLVFFMVTSTYLDLDTLPLVQDRAEAPDAPDPGPAAGPGAASVLMVRIAADGRPHLRGAALDQAGLAAALAAARRARPDLAVVVLPSAEADVQALVDVMEAAARAGAPALRVVRLEPAP